MRARRHSIRWRWASCRFTRHLTAVTCPSVVGHELYGPDERLLARGAHGELTDGDLKLPEHPGQLLHAERDDFVHPMWLSSQLPNCQAEPLPHTFAGARRCNSNSGFWEPRHQPLGFSCML